MKTFWDSRYDTEEFVYGKVANEFFASQLEFLKPGLLLLPGEGEGRNAVHAALRGWTVDAFDQSPVAAEKAHALAAENQVQIQYGISGIDTYVFPPAHYDAVSLVFLHTAPSLRNMLHQQVCSTLKPGGTVILEAFHSSQLGKNTGGPRNPEWLFTEEDLLSDFKDLEVVFLEQKGVRLEEGSFHKGEAEVIRFVGNKPKKNT